MAEPTVSVRGLDLELLATVEGERFLGLTSFTAEAYGVSYASLVLIGSDTLWFCHRHGLTEQTTARDGPLWDLVVATPSLILDDLDADPRFAGAPVIVGGNAVRTFISHTFRTPDGATVGALVLADPGVVPFDPANMARLREICQAFIEREITAARELDRAAEVQRALLPTTVPPLPGYEIAGSCVPAREVGGDFFDWYPIADGIAITLADVMGKGVGAGIIAATVRATLRSASRKKNVATAVERAGETLDDDLAQAGSFVTLFHARLRVGDGRLSYVDAGHGLTVLVRAEGGYQRLTGGDLPLGVLGETWRRRRVTLERGDTLVAFSDGVLDLYDGSLDAVAAVAELAGRARSAAALVATIEKLARRDTAPDDVTVLVVRRQKDDAR